MSEIIPKTSPTSSIDKARKRKQTKLKKLIKSIEYYNRQKPADGFKQTGQAAVFEDYNDYEDEFDGPPTSLIFIDTETTHRGHKFCYTFVKPASIVTRATICKTPRGAFSYPKKISYMGDLDIPLEAILSENHHVEQQHMLAHRHLLHKL